MNFDMETELETRSVTLSDIATTLGITKATVSYALSGKGRVAPETRELVLETAQKLGFRPNQHAQRLANGRCHDTVGLFAWSLDLGVTTRKLQLLQNLLAQRGYRAPIHVCGESLGGDDANFQVEAMSDLCAQSPLGIICNTGLLHCGVLRELERFRAKGGLVVCYDTPVEVECDQVLFDRQHNAYQAARHLLELGHRHIAFYGGWEKPNPQRRAGFEQAHREFGVALRPQWLLRGGGRPEDKGGFSEETGADLADVFLALLPRPTAICLSDDAVAAAFIAELLRRGVRVPHDISVVGADDLPLATYISAVPLTTVSQPVVRIAQTIVQLLCERAKGESTGAPRQIVLHGELIRRQSTARIDAQTSGL